MKQIIYNIEKLQETGEIEAVSAAENFADTRAYSRALDAFMEQTHKHLQYLPDVVVYVEDTRNLFIAEVKSIQASLTRLGMPHTATMFDGMIESANNGDAHGVSDRVVQYRALLEVYRRDLAAAAEEADAKPVVLAVDDMPETLTEIKNILIPDYDVIGITNPTQALKAAELHMPDVFLLDITMPDENGVELAGELRGNYLFEHTPLFFLTSSAKKEHVISAKELHSKGYILKPVVKKDLIKRLTKLFG